jgi:hypothetical protein
VAEGATVVVAGIEGGPNSWFLEAEISQGIYLTSPSWSNALESIFYRTGASTKHLLAL